MIQSVTVIGGGLAGCEAAWQLLNAGLSVTLIEARPAVQSPAHQSLLLGELVCSNSLRSDAAGTAAELLKVELRQAESLIMEAAEATRVPAGSALAVNRAAFSWRITASLLLHPRLTLQRRAVSNWPEGPCILATGPLTSPALAARLHSALGGGLYFYDAIAPIIDGGSIDWSQVYKGARRDPGSQDYVNCPLDGETYGRLVAALRDAEHVAPHPFEEPRYFEGCLPVEVMAARGDDVLSHGPLRPVGLEDPRTGKRPHAVVQLRAEDEVGLSYNLVGFQTRLLRREQRRVFRMIPGLGQCSFLRYGSIHRNSFIDAPRQTSPSLELHAAPRLTVAGQLGGVEGYLESVATGLLAGLFVGASVRGRRLEPPPPTTALGALLRHVTRPRELQERFEPSNITFGLLPPLASRIRKRRERRLAMRERALTDLAPWLRSAR
jgi:methylenetetrahydrofolate--tRNA-(uracil-5-)-methyltransferase